jgi:hypothetical protein
VLQAEPFNLAWGSSVYAKVMAINVYGSSLESPEGNGGVIITEPDAPLAPVTSSSGYDITISWQEPNSNGSPITEYGVYLRDLYGDYHQETIYCEGVTVT